MNAQSLHRQLVILSGAMGGHKEQADRYRAILLQILASKDPNQSEFLKIFIEASKFDKFNKHRLRNANLLQY